jgi:hypothetical protein
MMFLFVVILYFMENNNLYHNTTISGCDGAKVVLTSQAHTAAVFILRNEGALRRVRSDGMTCTPTLLKMH